jgi:hypothetical protein
MRMLIVLIRLTAVLILAAISGMVLTMCGNGEDGKMVDGLMALLPESVDGWRPVGQIETYDRETIFDYINGAGEVFLQYDFRECVVATYGNDGDSTVVVEIFDMTEPQEAYGIFSHVREEPEAGFGQGSQFAGSVLHFWHDRYFVSVYPKYQRGEHRMIVSKLATAVSESIGEVGTRPELVSYLPPQGLEPLTIRYFHLHPSLNYHYYLASENILNLSLETDAVLATYSGDRGKLLLVSYQNAQEADSALQSFRTNYLEESEEDAVEIEEGKWTAAVTYDRFLVAVFGAESAESVTELLAAAKNKLEAEAT